MYAGLVCPKNVLFLDFQQKFLSKTHTQNQHKTKTHHKPDKAEFRTGLRQLVGHLRCTITLIKDDLTAGEEVKNTWDVLLNLLELYEFYSFSSSEAHPTD